MVESFCDNVRISEVEVKSKNGEEGECRIEGCRNPARVPRHGARLYVFSNDERSPAHRADTTKYKIRVTQVVNAPCDVLYRAVCNEEGCRYNSGVAKQLAVYAAVGDPEYLNFSSNVLGPKGCVALVSTLRYFFNMRIVNLTGVGLDSEGCIAARRLWKRLARLHTIIVDKNGIYEIGGDALLQLARQNQKITTLSTSDTGITDYLSARIAKQLNVNDTGTAPIEQVLFQGYQDIDIKLLEGVWVGLVKPPFCDPKSANISSRFEILMRDVDAAMSCYKNKGLQVLFHPHLDDLPAAGSITTTNDITFKTCFYSALCIGITALITETWPTAIPTLSTFGDLHQAFGLRDHHLTTFLVASTSSLTSSLDLSPQDVLAWQHGVVAICKAMIPVDGYPL
eukprot:TRINITY_DN9806_c1_g1_i1.p1 TRINITY_DN9806_c1_g1~~TRINITY_DN9806_c1_g1_i1.p1  ORF type:complete len:396 (+),score=80.79 TRINITY_DN9806_c1_g1_i1:49-1236(+)